MLGENIKNPSDIIKKASSEKILIFEINFDFQRIKDASGDKNNIIEGDPNNPCNLCGYENNPAPNIEKVKVQRIKIGTILSPTFLHTLKSPMLNKALKTEVKTSPNVNIC